MSTFNYGRACTPGDIAATYSAGTAVGLRWAATIVDVIVILIMGGVAMSLFDKVAPGAGVVVALGLVTVYYVVMEGLLGQTVGKMLLRIKVVDDSGNVPGIGKAIIRTLLRLIEINPILMGGIPAGVVVNSSSKRQRLGDMLAHTYVLRVADVDQLRMGTATAYPPMPSQAFPYVPGAPSHPGYPPPPGVAQPPFDQAGGPPQPSGVYTPPLGPLAPPPPVTEAAPIPPPPPTPGA